MKLRNHTARAIAVPLVLLVTACASNRHLDAPQDLRPITPPSSWDAAPQAATQLPSQPEWWTTFNDPQLDRLIPIALQHNHDLLAAAARVDQAQAQARIAGADRKPQVNAGLNAARRRQVFVGLPIPGGNLSTTSTQFGASIDTSWEADLWGRLRANQRAALADQGAVQADLDAARLSIAGQTAKVWFAVAEAHQQVELAQRSAESFRNLANQIRERYERGVRPALDLRLALSNQATAEALVEQRNRQRDAAKRQLQVLLGRYPTASGLTQTHATQALMATPPAIPGGLPADLVARRPDLVAAEQRLFASDQRHVAARRALYPRLTLTGSTGTISDELGDLLDGDFGVWSLVGNLLQPLFQGGRLRAGVDLANAGVDEALARYAGRVLQAYAEVETALAAETWLAQEMAKVQVAVEQLVAAERLAEDRYRTGVGGFLTVLESQTRALTAQSTLLALERARLDNRVDLHLALGGGFQAPPTPRWTRRNAPTEQEGS